MLAWLWRLFRPKTEAEKFAEMHKRVTKWFNSGPIVIFTPPPDRR